MTSGDDFSYSYMLVWSLFLVAFYGSKSGGPTGTRGSYQVTTVTQCATVVVSARVICLCIITNLEDLSLSLDHPK